MHIRIMISGGMLIILVLYFIHRAHMFTNNVNINTDNARGLTAHKFLEKP